MRRPTWLLLAALPLVLLVGAAAFVVFRAQQTVNRESAKVAREGRYPFEMRTLGRPENPGFEAIASPASFVSGALYRGRLYVTSPSGLFVYGSEDGLGNKLLKTYRVGLDLPAAPLGSVVVGRIRGASEPELLIATGGEGVLIFSGDSNGTGSFRQIRPRDAEARDVTALLPLATGELLIGTRRKGLLVYRGGNAGPSGPTDPSDQSYQSYPSLDTFQPQFAELDITALAADSTGFWAGTRNQGLRHVHGGQIDSFHASQSNGEGELPDEEVDSLAVRGDKVYAGTPVGVEEFDDGRPARVLAAGLFASALYADDKAVTIGSIDQGIRRVSLEARSRPAAAPAAFDTAEGETGASEQFLSARQDGNEDLLAVTRDAVLERRGSAWNRFAANSERSSGAGPVLTDGNISALAFDAEGRLWIGTFDRGLDILAPGGERVEHREDDRLFCVNRIALDPRRGTMAVATANGLVLFDAQGRQRQALTKRDGLIADHVTDIAFAGETMVVATPAGLTFVDGGGARSLYAFEGLVNNHVYALGSRPGSSEILAGTLGGISDLISESVRRNLTVANSGLKHNWVTAIIPMDGAGGGWMVGTYGAGAMRLDKDGRFEAMEGATRPMEVNPNAMLATREHVFAGTLGEGLWVYSRANGHWRQVRAGLPSGNVTALAERDGEIYVGTENGLVRIAERLLE